MNHLAHLFLSQSDVNLMVGNFIADNVKGKQINSFSEEVIKGIKMHRAIDSFTDQHAVVQKSKERLYPKYHKYSAVIVDMFYDHILAKNWANYSPIALEKFTTTVYQLLNAQKDSFPSLSKQFLYYMSRYDWLSSYASDEGISKALEGLSRRAKFDSKMDESALDLRIDYLLYEKEFTKFFPELYEHCQEWVQHLD